MENRARTLRDKVRQLRVTFLERLPGTIREGRQLCGRIADPESGVQPVDDLYRLFHSIKGTSGSFGLGAIRTRAAEGEEVVRRLQAQPPGERMALLPEIDVVLAAIETLGGIAANEADEQPLVPQMPDVPLAEGGSARKRVFVCDDDDLQGERLGTQLACFGYGVSVFSSAEGLQAAVVASPPDAIVMDIMFPAGASVGTDVVSGLRKAMRNPPPTVFLSARRDFEARFNSVQAGGEAYFVKPVKVIDLVEVLDQITMRREPEPFRILIVDDEPEVAAYHSFILEQVGMVTACLDAPSRIMDVLAEFKPELVLMDMYMPGCNGRDLARVIRQIPEFLSLPIVFLSSETDKTKQVSALRTVGAEGFLNKPIEPDDLVSAVAIRAERMRVLRSLMVRDSLTGLFNHTFLSQTLETAVAAAARDGAQLCFAMLDVDRFKSVNDTWGHPMGDQVLVTLARLLQQRLRTSDVVGRYGGEEFGIILRDLPAGEAAQVVDSLRENFGKVRFDAGGGEFTCTFSAGIAHFPACFGAEAMVEAADRALYRAKGQGRNQVVLAGKEENCR